MRDSVSPPTCSDGRRQNVVTTTLQEEEEEEEEEDDDNETHFIALEEKPRSLGNY